MSTDFEGDLFAIQQPDGTFNIDSAIPPGTDPASVAFFRVKSHVKLRDRANNLTQWANALRENGATVINRGGQSRGTSAVLVQAGKPVQKFPPTSEFRPNLQGAQGYRKKNP